VTKKLCQLLNDDIVFKLRYLALNKGTYGPANRSSGD
jgi:hypothetical protein